jgi:spore coat protein CotH
MRASRFCCLALVFSALGGAWAQVAAADEAAAMYDPSAVDVIELTLSKESEETLEKEPTENYVKGTLTLRETGGVPGTEGPPVIDAMEVGIRLKGNEGGSFRKLKDGKAAFKIKCNFVKGKKCLGLKKMTLNNMVQDPSMVHETLAYSAFRAAGVPASRTGYAYVRVNGQDFGLYLNLETLDEVSLGRLFDSPFEAKTQHLYEGEEGHDVTPGEAPEFEIDEGEADRADLEALIEAVNGTGSGSWSTRVSPYADLAEMTEMWAVEKYIDHWDGYSGHAEPLLRPNNYYLYSEPSGRFQMLPWGADQTWIPTKGVANREVTFDGHGGVLFDKCIEDSECFHVYGTALRGVRNTIAGLDPGALAEATAKLLAPWQKEEREHGRAESNATRAEEGLDETLDFIAGRPAEADQWLAVNAPEPPAPSTPSGPPVSHGSPGPARMRIDGFAVANGGVLTTHMYVSGSGEIDQWAKIRLAKKDVGVCLTNESASNAESLALHCRLSPGARRRLRARRLKITVYTVFTPTGESPETVSHVVTAHRDPPK